MLLPFPSNDHYFTLPNVKRFYVLHEFGHALGFEHEHQRVDCDFDYNFIAQNFNFASAAEARNNMDRVFSYQSSAYPDGKVIIDADFISTQFDNYSVMKYNLSTQQAPSGDDPRVYRNGRSSLCYRDGWVSALTKYDHAGAKAAYDAPAESAIVLARFANDESATLSSNARKQLASGAARASTGGLMSLEPDKPSVTDLKNSILLVRSSNSAMKVLNKLFAE